MAATLRRWVRQHERGTGQREGLTTAEARRIKELEHENGQRVFHSGGARPPAQVMRAFFDKHRDVHGVEPICQVLQIAPSGRRRRVARLRTPALCSPCAQRDAALLAHIECVWRANLQVYDTKKVWLQLHREGSAVARCTVERLMRRHGLCGVIRGKVVRTTVADPKAPCPLDKVNRQSRASMPIQLWGSDSTYV